MAIFYTP